MSSLFRIGQVLRGGIGTYTTTQTLRDAVWFAKNQVQKTVVIKSVHGHHGVTNERDVLKRFQHRTPYIRAMIDEIHGPSFPVTIAFEYLESNIWNTSAEKALNRKELRHVSRCILEALRTLHDGGYVHADAKPHTVFVNLQEGNNRFTEVKLGDLGNCSPVTSKGLTSGALAGAPTWSNPEIILQMPWNTAIDIWSFGAVFVQMIYGSRFNLCTPQSPSGEDDLPNLPLDVLLQQLRWLGPFPGKIDEIATPEAVDAISALREANLPEQQALFEAIPESELLKKDNEFIRRIMKLDWRDRPSAKNLLEDPWWKDECSRCGT